MSRSWRPAPAPGPSRNLRLAFRRSRLLLSSLLVATLFAPPAGAQVINEVVANHTGLDDHEFLEVLGAPNTDYSNLTLLQLEGDSGSNPGSVDGVISVGTTAASGHWVTSFLNNQLENGTTTFLLVDAFSGSLGQDLDSNDDGSLDLTPWTTLLDSVAIFDGDADATYSTSVLGPNFDGISFTPGGLSRIPDGVDTNTAADWVRNDFDGAGLPGFSGTLAANEALNTPGSTNSTDGGGSGGGEDPMLSEIVLDHLGSDTHEFLEIFGDPVSDYSTASLVVLDSSGNPGLITGIYSAGVTDSDGFWATPFQVDTLADAGVTILLVEGFSGSVSQDLDTNDDGTLEIAPWTTLFDSVAIVDPAGGDVAYSTTILTPNFDGDATSPGGVSRIPYGQDTDTAADWRRNDFDGEGLPGFLGTLQPGEALNTPARVNLEEITDYYSQIDLSDATTLRGTLHSTIDDHVRFPYSASSTDTWDILELADEDPGASSNILDIYKNASYAKQGGGNSFYNREHSWPRSYGFPDDGATNYPHNDCHHLLLSDITYNSDRGNLAFGTCNAGCSEDPTESNGGQGGGSGTYPGNSNWYTGSGGTGIWETWGNKKGDVARAQLYMDLRYEGGMHRVTGAAEPNLILTDDTGLIQTTGINSSTAYMGRLATLLAWHAQDPVDAGELLRNEVIYHFQGNRNPFVDHPEWVACIYSGASCAVANPEIFADGFETGDTAAWSSVVTGL